MELQDTLRVLLLNAVALFIFMSLTFVVARFRKRLDTVDTAWGLGFIVATGATLGVDNASHSIARWLSWLVIIWGLRLSSHIYLRNRRRQDDRRYLELTHKWRGSFWLRAYWSIFLLQGALIWAISLPLAILTGADLGYLVSASSPLSKIGAFIWLVGFVIEVTADLQLSAYLKLKDRPKVMETGLWRYSRHPNYFGELTLWWGIGIVVLQAPYGWVGLLGPLLLSYLIIFISGIPPIEKRRQKDAEYRQYQSRTSPLIPLPPRL